MNNEELDSYNKAAQRAMDIVRHDDGITTDELMRIMIKEGYRRGVATSAIWKSIEGDYIVLDKNWCLHESDDPGVGW